MRRFSLVLCFALLAPLAARAQTGTIETVAGGGPNNLPAVEANLRDPRGVAVHAAGNLYIAASGQNRVFKVDTSGLLTVYAGNGTPSFSGDGGPATSAGLRGPSGVAVDANGNLFIAELANNRIRRVDASTGIITTVAGNGTPGFSGDGGPATSASLRNPRDVALDANGNLFIVSNNRIRRVDASTGIITTVAGSGSEFDLGFSGDGGPATSAKLNGPSGVAVDANGNLFIADLSNQRIRRMDAATGIITTVAGNGTLGFSGDGGPATSASLFRPSAVAVDTNGNLFIAVTSNSRIRRVDASTGIIATVAGSFGGGFSGDGGPAISAGLNVPAGVAVDTNGNLFIADNGNLRIRRVDASTGIINTVAGNGTGGFSGDGGPATGASLHTPSGMVVDGNRNLFIADSLNHRIRRVDASTGIITTVAGHAIGGFFSGDGGPATSANLSVPSGVAVDANGNLFIADTSSHRIRRVNASTGIITTVAGNGTQGSSGDGGPATSASLGFPRDVSLDANGNLFISDGFHRIRRVDASTGIITTVAGTGGTGGFSGDGGPATSASLRFPTGVALDASGNLFIADNGNQRIRRVVASTGIINTVAGNGISGFGGDGGPATSASLSAPSGVAVDASGDLFIAEGLNNRIRRVDASTGIITTVAGSGVFGFSGDGGPATDARLAFPVRVALGAGLFIADSSNQRIRRVILNQPPVADAGPDQTLILGEPGTFDGSASFDPDGTIEGYLWDFGDGNSSSGAVVRHAYAADGTFTATLTVTDDQGATGNDTALVTVVTPSQAIDLLEDIVQSYNLQQGISNSLDKKLELARGALDAANAGLRADAANKLGSFINEVEAQRGKELTGAQADELIGWARRIISVL